MKRAGIALGVVLLAVAAGTAGAALSGHQQPAATQTAGGATLTGCLSRSGKLDDVAVGQNPRKRCERDETLVHLGSGDITSVTAGTGLAGGGGGGNVDLAIAPSFRLPQGCNAHQAPSFAAPAWTCGTFAGAGQNCQVGQVISGIDATGAVSCSAPLSTSQLPVGDGNCPTGGTSLTINGGTSFICNGLQGDTGPPGEQGPAGTANVESSPSGEYSIEVTDLGVYIHGPSGTLVVNNSGSFFSSDPFYEG